MSHAPWYKRYPADFNADPYVQAMTAEQYGWYSAMLDAAWLHTPQGYIPNAIDLLCRMVGRCDEMHFAKHAQIVLDRFQKTEDGKYLYHPKMLEQVAKLTEVSEKRRDVGKRGAEKRWKQPNSNCHKSEKQLPTDVDSESDNPLGGDEQILKIAKAYPKTSQFNNETEIPDYIVRAIAGAIERDGFEPVLAATKRAKGDRAPYPFFAESAYREFLPKSPSKPKWDVVAASKAALV